MIRNFALALTSLCTGAILTSLYFSFGQVAKTGTQANLDASHVREVLRHVHLQVPANVLATGDQVVAADDNGRRLVEFRSSPNGPRTILLVKAQISFGIEIDRSPGLSVKTDEEKKVATITLPSPHFIGISDSPEDVAFTVGSADQSGTAALKKQALSFLHREATAPRYTEAAKALCTARLTAVANALGYTAEIIWTAPGTHHRSRAPL